MAFPPQKFREIVFQILYSKSFSLPDKELGAMLMKELKITKKIVLEAVNQAMLISEKLSQIDALISTFSEGYVFERISSVEKTILRLSSYELLYSSQIPKEVVFAEAARLTKKFSSNESSKYVNAILDRIQAESSCPPLKDL